MYGDLLEALVEDLRAGGPAAEVLAGHEDDPGPSALGLRLLGSVHRLVLERRAGGLAACYPSVGGVWEPRAGWAAFRELLGREPGAVRAWLDRPPQTNEVGRAAALVGGLLHLEDAARLPVRIVELGASGGLNLLADRFGYLDESGTAYGDPGSPVTLVDAWRGARLRPWPGLRFVERVGCDARPVDVASAEGRLALTAYVWPDQPERMERLRGALRLARDTPVQVREESAVDLIAQVAPEPGALTVVWHSVVWQYLDAEEQVAVSGHLERLGEEASAGAPVAHLLLEPMRPAPGREHEFLVVLRAWPGGERRVLGSSRGHGVPTTWSSAAVGPHDAGHG